MNFIDKALFMAIVAIASAVAMIPAAAAPVARGLSDGVLAVTLYDQVNEKVDKTTLCHF